MAQPFDLPKAMELLDAAPVGVLVYGSGDRVVWGNTAIQRFLGLGAEELGHCKDHEILGGYLAPGGDGGLFYVSADDTRAERWLRVVDAATGGEEAVKIRYFTDVTEQQRLRDQVAALNDRLQLRETADTLTGLLNRRALMQELESQVSRSRRYGNPLAVVTLEIASYESHNKGVTPVTDQVVLAISYFLRDQLRWVDLIGRVSVACFTLVLPETPEADAEKLVDKLKERLNSLPLPEAEGVAVEVKADFGIAAWCKGDDTSKLLRRLEESLSTARETA